MKMTPLRGLFLAVLVVVLDQISKWWIVDVLMRPEGVEHSPYFGASPIEMTSFFNIVMVWNPGVSFGMFNSLHDDYRVWVLAGLSLFVAAILLFWMFRAKGFLQIVSLGLIIGGAVGNVIDRVRFGAVADFLDVHVAGYHWPAFNVADSAITIGAILLFVETLFSRRRAS